MTTIDSQRVIFFQVDSAAAKLVCLSKVAEAHFFKKEHLLFIAEENKGLAFVDELLWKYPPESFLPHAIVEEECSDWIAITKIKKNLNHARFVFNLCPTPLLIEGPFSIIYDFEDTSSPNKKLLSSARFDAYKQAGFLIESRIVS